MNVSAPSPIFVRFIVLAVISSWIMVSGCKQDAGSAPAPPVAQVEVITVMTQTIPDEPEFIG